MISASQIKSLRDKTSLSISACKKALEESVGDETKALEYLKTAGEKIAVKKSERNLGAGIVMLVPAFVGVQIIILGIFGQSVGQFDFIVISPFHQFFQI